MEYGWQSPRRGSGRVRTEPQPTILTVPGFGNSGPEHWQSLWEAANPALQRVELGNWDAPERDAWVSRLGSHIAEAEQPVVLVAHSLGCLTVAWWAALVQRTYRIPVAGALLVAPADPLVLAQYPQIQGFGVLPLLPLPFPSILVASQTDPYMAFSKARDVAGHWGSLLVDAGDAGHINSESGHGSWAAGQAHLQRLLAAVTPVPASLPARPSNILSEQGACL